jgi:hypothetical protein
LKSTLNIVKLITMHYAGEDLGILEDLKKLRSKSVKVRTGPEDQDPKNCKFLPPRQTHTGVHHRAAAGESH